MSDDFCGCCGRPCRGMWCTQCLSHIAPAGPPFWERTYEFVVGAPCPYQAGAR